ncbi:MAG: helix-turn-helix domain-containing protein, partial [bacterium]
PVQEVAAAVGFENPYHFSATFKRKTGISPTQWRRRHEAVESIGDHSGASSGDPLQETERR